MNVRDDPSVLEDSWLSTKALAGRLGICELSVRRWVSTGRLPPPVRIGRSVRWPWSKVVAWVSNKA